MVNTLPATTPNSIRMLSEVIDAIFTTHSLDTNPVDCTLPTRIECYQPVLVLRYLLNLGYTSSINDNIRIQV